MGMVSAVTQPSALLIWSPPGGAMLSSCWVPTRLPEHMPALAVESPPLHNPIKITPKLQNNLHSEPLESG